MYKYVRGEWQSRIKKTERGRSTVKARHQNSLPLTTNLSQNVTEPSKGWRQNSGGCNCNCLQPFAKSGNIIISLEASINDQILIYVVSMLLSMHT